MSDFSKIVHDTCNDEIEVTFERDQEVVWLSIDDSVGEQKAYANLTPKQARRLAKALRKAAKIAKENA